MNINKDNYEAFFLLYTDNELNADDRKAVDYFVETHPELKEELNALLQTRLSIEESVFSFDKTDLYRSETDGAVVHAANYESYFLMYIDDELTNEERTHVERFIAKHPAKKAALDLLCSVKVQPDEEITFKNKSLLYRRETPVVSVVAHWRRIVAAASIILIGALVWSNFNDFKEQFENPSKEAQLASADTVEKDKAAGTDGSNDRMISAEKTNEVTANVAGVQATERIRERPLAKATQSGNLLMINNSLEGSTKKDKPEAVQPAAVKLATADPLNIPVAISPAVREESKMPNTLKPAVAPVILDQEAFNGTDDEDDQLTNSTLTLADTDNAEKKSKGAFRGLFRKASRFVNRATNADEDVAVVRIASFEIAKK